MSLEFDFILKMSLQETLSTIPKKLGFILKVSLHETPFTIPQNPIYTKGVMNFNFHLSQFHKF